MHEFWLANIQDQCIIGLDLLTRWGAQVDVLRPAITLGTETVALQLGQKKKKRPKNQQASHEAAYTPSPASKPVTTSSPAPPQPPTTSNSTPPQPATTPAAEPANLPSAETVKVVHDLWQRSSDGLDVQQRQQLKRLLDDNVDIFAAGDKDCRQTGLVQHTIETGSAQPIRLRPHRLALSKRQVAEDMIREMAAAGVIEPSNSPWAAPAVLVKKKNGSWRFCVDYRRLNAVTRKDSYPLPRIDDALDHIAGSCWFSSLDLRSGYWQVELAPEARPKTAFTIGQGLWQFRVMPFGLCNAPATFERLMERVLVDIPLSRCVVYLDDLLVHANDFDSALANLEEVFTAIRGAGLRLNPAKCHLLTRETAFLGHVVSAHGVATDPVKVAAVQDWPTPANISELRSFLGLASYYRRFVRDFATIASPLYRLSDKGRSFDWDEACSAAFDRLKRALTAAPVLAYPDAQQPFIVDTDASNVGVGAVLSQQREDGEHAVAYFSRALTRPERNYCVTRRELLAVVLAIRHFRPYLHGSHFLLRTDHASLTWLLNFKNPEGQVARWLEALQEYDFEIQHRAGRQHGNADSLSRRPCAAVECRYCRRQEERSQLAPAVSAVQTVTDEERWSPLTKQQLRQEQGADPSLALVQGWLETGGRPEWTDVSPQGPEVKSYHSQWGNIELHDNLLYRRWQAPRQGRDLLQLLVPRSLRTQVLQIVHGSVGAGHYGNAKTLQRLRARFYWPGCRRDVELHVHCCDSCTAKKGPTQRSHAPLQQYLVGAPMERVGVDILGPFPVTDSGNRYILVAMDYFTKWPEAFAVPDQSAATTAEKLVEEMFTRFGVPEQLHSDQGRNFESQLFGEVCRRLGVDKTRTTPLHPQSDGLVERFNRTLATQLAILTSQHQRDWDRHLPLVLWSYRTAVQESSHCTPAALMFGRELRTPVDLVFGAPPEPEIPGGAELDYFQRLKERLQVVHDYTRQAQADAGVRQKRAYDTRCRGRAFTSGEKVWVYCPVRKKGVSPKLCSHWQGPGEVLARLSEVVYRVRMPGKGRVVVLHQDRLAPYRPLAVPEEDPGSAPPSGPIDSYPSALPVCPDRPTRPRRPPEHLRDYVLGDGVVEDD
ncbi:retrovirus-related Pol polyprotein from transposon 412 [Tautogolabrus adspersus]